MFPVVEVFVGEESAEVTWTGARARCVDGVRASRRELGDVHLAWDPFLAAAGFSPLGYLNRAADVLRHTRPRIRHNDLQLAALADGTGHFVHLLCVCCQMGRDADEVLASLMPDAYGTKQCHG